MVILEHYSSRIIEGRIYSFKGTAYLALTGMAPLEEIVIPDGYPVTFKIGAYNNYATMRIEREPRDG